MILLRQHTLHFNQRISYHLILPLAHQRLPWKLNQRSVLPPPRQSQAQLRIQQAEHEFGPPTKRQVIFLLTISYSTSFLQFGPMELLWTGLKIEARPN